jgi:hypothetical protein
VCLMRLRVNSMRAAACDCDPLQVLCLIIVIAIISIVVVRRKKVSKCSHRCTVCGCTPTRITRIAT